ncbi:MAG: Holliday junction branch migration protein RuvA [Patescibacteria group bacterium]
MISYLRGTVLAQKERYIILVVERAVGYRVHVTAQFLEHVQTNDDIELFIHTHVREDLLELYGFSTMEELEFFDQLNTVSGVGPKSALGVMSVAPLTDVKKAIIHGDPALLQKVSSIGKKTAERIIVELKEKITVTGSDEKGGMSITENVQLFEALSSLGYKDSEIRSAIRRIPAEAKELQDKIKEALKVLSKRS